ncbi:MAG: hypothetical protein AAGD38_11535 [Acidobacteriota bacterium]
MHIDELPDEVTRRVETTLAERPSKADADPAKSAVLFYRHEHLAFAYAWAEGDEANRWIFPVEPLGPTFMYYVLKRLQDIGLAARQILIDSKGQGALFYTTTEDVPITSDLVVGLLPGNTTAADFGSTVSTFAPGAVLTLLADSVAGSTDYESTTYDGTDLIGLLASFICGFASTCGCTLASDQAVTLVDDGTATTAGNIWGGDAATGNASILYPAPGQGEQSYPLAMSACTPS